MAMSRVISLPALPYSEDALAPLVSARTVALHYGKHHRTYVENLNRLIDGTELEGHALEEVIAMTADRADKTEIFNNAAQAWNHDFYWHSLSPHGGGRPQGELADRVESTFGSYEDFRKAFTRAAQSQFGSGWVWLVEDSGALKVVKTVNAELPRARGQRPLVTVDVWEHAYYLDYYNRRVDYVDSVLEKLIDWTFVLQNLAEDRNPSLFGESAHAA
jgi:superoxide dismutase, Fe-Mn family